MYRFLSLLALLTVATSPALAQSKSSSTQTNDGITYMSQAVPAGTSGTPSQPEILVSLQKLPSDWKTCQSDSDCAVAHFGDKPLAVNKAHAKDIENALSRMGLAVKEDPELEQASKDDPNFKKGLDMVHIAKAVCVRNSSLQQDQLKIDPASSEAHPDSTLVTSGIPSESVPMCGLVF